MQSVLLIFKKKYRLAKRISDEVNVSFFRQKINFIRDQILRLIENELIVPDPEKKNNHSENKIIDCFEISGTKNIENEIVECIEISDTTNIESGNKNGENEFSECLEISGAKKEYEIIECIEVSGTVEIDLNHEESTNEHYSNMMILANTSYSISDGKFFLILIIF